MIVLGIDPSLCNTGLAIVRLLPGGGEDVLESSVVRTEPSGKKRKILVGDDDTRRVAEIVAGLDALIRTHSPAALVMETPTGAKGARAARALALAFASVVAVAKLARLPLVQVTPGDVKHAVCRSKNASKDDVLLAVETRYPGVSWTGPQSTWEHQADAIAAVVAALDSETLRMARRLSA